jgi:beta-fructofuranosidase
MSAIAFLAVISLASAEVSRPCRAADLPKRLRIVGDGWQVAGNPDLGELSGPNQRPVGFAVWQAADGTRQFWSCGDPQATSAPERNGKALPKPAAAPRIGGPYVHVYAPGPDIFPGPDSEHFEAGRSYAEWVPNDHAILKGADGRWHALGITHPKPPADAQGVHEAEWLLFHAVSPEGRLKEQLREGAWRDAPKVLAPADRPGEVRECYAPSIVQKDGIYHMFYGPNPLRMAASGDLYTWKPTGALFNQKGGVRDPCVVCHGGRYVVYYVTGRSVLARTSPDLRAWNGEPVEVFRMRRGGEPESPTVVERDGQFYLFWCLWDAADKVNGSYDNRTFVFRSGDPLDFHAAPCVAQLQAHAPEIFRDEDGDWFLSSVEWPKRGVSIAPLIWK